MRFFDSGRRRGGVPSTALAVASLCGLAGFPPLALWVGFGGFRSHPWLTIVTALLWAGAVFGAARLLAPLEGLRCALNRAAARLGLDEPADGSLRALGLSARAIAAAIRRAKSRTIPARAEFLAATPKGAGAVAVIALADYPRLASFDADGADETARAFGHRLQRSLAAGRSCGRLERGAFAVWLPGAIDEVAAELRALGYVMRQPLKTGSRALRPEILIAAAARAPDVEDPAELLSLALAALPRPGAVRPGEVVFAGPEAAAASRAAFALQQGLRQALDQNAFVLHYQPVVDLEAGALLGAEALVRWRHPSMGLVPPSTFIPMLEVSDLMEEAGRWILDHACKQAAAFRAQGLADFRMAVNVSPLQLRDGALPKLVRGLLARHGLTAETLEIELTESAALEDEGRTRALLEGLREMGVGVAIDDFGTGYSSLAKLETLPFAKLKIDRAFAHGVSAHASRQAICAALIELARGLSMKVLAEGVEEMADIAWLAQVGCRLFQGYHFGRPMEPETFLETVKDAGWWARLRLTTGRRKEAA